MVKKKIIELNSLSSIQSDAIIFGTRDLMKLKYQTKHFLNQATNVSKQQIHQTIFWQLSLFHRNSAESHSNLYSTGFTSHKTLIQEISCSNPQNHAKKTKLFPLHNLSYTEPHKPRKKIPDRRHTFKAFLIGKISLHFFSFVEWVIPL